MYRDQGVAVVLPCFNVAEHVETVVRGLPDWVDHIVAVEDASTDGTAERLRAIADPRLVVLVHERNGGMGAAMRTGLEEAFRRGADIGVKMDGDGQMDPGQLPRLLDPLCGDDPVSYTKGNRLFDRRALRSMPRVRMFGNFVLTFLSKLASGYWHLLDPVNGYAAIRRDAWHAIDVERLHRGYFYQADILVELNIIDARVRDVAIPARYGSERSSLRIRREVPVFSGLLIRRMFHRFWTKYVVRDFSPIALFALTGSILFLWGALFGAWAWWDHARQGLVTPTGTVMLSVLPLFVGFELLLQALVLDIQHTPRER